MKSTLFISISTIYLSHSYTIHLQKYSIGHPHTSESVNHLALVHNSLFQFINCGWMLISCYSPTSILQITPKEKISNSKIWRSRGPRHVSALTDDLPWKAVSKICHADIASVGWCTILLPPNIFLVYSKSVVLNTGTIQNQPEPSRTSQNHPEPSGTSQNQPETSRTIRHSKP